MDLFSEFQQRHPDFTYEQTCDSVPVQHEGRLGGEWWYFRYRHGRYRLTIGVTLDEAVSASMDLPGHGRVLAEGVMGGRYTGWLPDDTAPFIIVETLDAYRRGELR